MTEFKSLLASRGVWGAAIAIAAGVASLFGYVVDAASQEEALRLAEGAAAVAGGLLALWGRLAATKRLR